MIALYHMIYPNANRLVINNMCYLLGIGFIILTRLSYNKAIRQFVIAVASFIIALFVPNLMTRVKNWKEYVWFYGAAGIISLGAVLALGAVTNGSKLSFYLFGVRFQP